MAVQHSRRSRIACDLRRDAAHASGVEGTDQQDGPQRCARHRADDAGGALSSGACEDDTQSETADAADSSQAAAEQLIEVIACGRSATEMPHFDKYAYEDKACYGPSAGELGKDVPPDPHST